MIDIYIPSYKRPSTLLLRRLTQAKVPFSVVIDHETDVDDYERQYRGTSGKVLYVEGGGRGIGYVRQCIKDRYRGVPVMMLDDDTELRYRDFYNPRKTVTCKAADEVAKWFSIVDGFIRENKFDIGSCADHIYKWRDTSRVLNWGSLCSVTIFDSDRVHEIDYDANLYRRMEDHDLALQAIRHRFRFAVCNEALRHCPMNKAGKDVGGCSEVYRDEKAMFATTSYLVAKWGRDIVTFDDDKRIGNYCDFHVNYREMRRRYGYEL